MKNIRFLFLNKPNDLLVYLGIFLSISPDIAWIIFDRHVWPWDQAWYGQVSVELFYTLVNYPLSWIASMLGAFGTKAPAIAWLGQFFVPVGVLFGSIDMGLLLSVVITQFILLVLIFKSVQELSKNRILIVVIATLVVASAPLFVAMSHQYFVESVQTLAVAWFILIMSFAPKWDRKFIISQLVAAISLAMLAKITSPLYCLFPSLLALTFVFFPNLSYKQPDIIISPTKVFLDKISLYVAISLSIAAITWYAKNISQVLKFAALSSSGSVSELFGKSDTFVNKIVYWLSATQSSFFFPGILIFVIMVFILGFTKFFCENRRTGVISYFTICASVSLLSIVIGILAFTLNINQETRYLLPLIPYVALIISWSTLEINKQLLTAFVVLVFIVQLAAVHSQGLGIIKPNSSISYWLYTVDNNARNARNLNEIVQKTCQDKDKDHYNIVGVELPWLNANSVSYFSTKQLVHRQFRCYYKSLGFAEQNTNKAWERVLTFKTNYFISLRRDLYPQTDDPFNKVALPMLDKIQVSKIFKLDYLIDESRILIFKNVMDIQ